MCQCVFLLTFPGLNFFIILLCKKIDFFLNDAFELYSNRSFKSSVKPFRVTLVDSGVPDLQKQAIRYKFFVMNKSSLCHGKANVA